MSVKNRIMIYGPKDDRQRVELLAARRLRYVFRTGSAFCRLLLG
jgi:hypothetical protein